MTSHGDGLTRTLAGWIWAWSSPPLCAPRGPAAARRDLGNRLRRGRRAHAFAPARRWGTLPSSCRRLSGRRGSPRAAGKFGPFSARMLFTRAGLEQATRLSIAGAMRRGSATPEGDLHRRPRLRHRRRTPRPRRTGPEGRRGRRRRGYRDRRLQPRAVREDVVVSMPGRRRTDAAASGIGRPRALAVWLRPKRSTAGTPRPRAPARGLVPSLDWVFGLAERLPRASARTGLDRRCCPGRGGAQWVAPKGHHRARRGPGARAAGGAGRRCAVGVESAMGDDAWGRMPRTSRCASSAHSSTSPMEPYPRGSSAMSHGRSRRGCSTSTSPTSRRCRAHEPVGVASFQVRGLPADAKKLKGARARHRPARDQEAGSGCRSRRLRRSSRPEGLRDDRRGRASWQGSFVAGVGLADAGYWAWSERA